MQQSIAERFPIREGMTVSVRKSKVGQDLMISLGEGKIKTVRDDKISIHIPFLRDNIEDADRIKVFWEDGRYYFCGTASNFYPNHAQFDLLTIEGLDRVYYIEKRRHIRLSHNLNIDYKWITPTLPVFGRYSKGIRMGLGENLSCGGTEFITSDRLGVDDIIELGFEIPSFSSYMIFTQARVVRVSHSNNPPMPYKVAVQFLNMDIHDQRLIAEFILNEISSKDASNKEDEKGWPC